MRVSKYRTFFLTVILFVPLLGAESPVPTHTAVPDPPASDEVSERMDATADVVGTSIDWMTSYNDARKKGKASELPVLLFVTMEECRYCVKMQRDSFDDPSVAKEISDSFVPTKLYLDPESALAESLKITIFPTTMFIAPDGKILGYVRGYVPTERFRTELSAAKSENAERLRLARLERTKTTK